MFLKLTFAVRTMAGGTSRGDLGSSLGQRVASGAHRAPLVEVVRVGKCPDGLLENEGGAFLTP